MSGLSELEARKAKLDAARRKLLEKRLKGGRTTARDDRIPRREGEEPVPLSYTQQRFWFLQQLDPDSPAYNMHEAWRVRGALDLDALQQALNRVMARHAVLRTTIGLKDDVPVQQVHPHLNLTIETVDLMDVAPGKIEQTLKKLARDEARRLFDLEKGPLLRLSAARFGPADHALLLTIHHLISDEYANDLFWQELAYFYGRALGEPTAGEPPALPIQYDDFTTWQIDWLQAGEEARQLAYWKKQLAGRPETLPLPLDRPRPPRQTFNGGFERRTLSQALVRPLQELIQATGATPFMVFLAAFQTLLNRYSHSDDIWVGTPIANRQRGEVQHLLGLFLNTIILRSRFEPTLTFSRLVRQVQGSALDALAHQDVPFERLVDELKPVRDPSTHPLFQVMFVYSPAAALSRSLPGCVFEEIPVDGGVAKFDLTLFISAGEEKIEAACEYNSDLFDRETISRLLGHLETLLAAALADPDRPLVELPLLTAGERQQILVDWNATAQSFPAQRLLHELIGRHAASIPEHPAVRASGRQISYGDLERRANRLAHFLRARGVRPDSFVGLLAGRQPEMIVGILAILKAGGAYVPLDPDYPAERLLAICEDADLALILAGDPAAAANLHLVGVDIIDLSRFDDDQQFPSTPPETALTPENLAYAIFTSGSTGRPKGVLVSHRNIVHSTSARFSFYPHPAERFLLLSSFAFDSSMVGVFWTLCQGGTLVLPGDGLHQDVLYLAETIYKQRVTHLLALPSLYQLLLDESEPGKLTSLNTVMVAGEACHPGLVRDHHDRAPQAVLYNEYGPTEGTVWSHAYRFPAGFSGPAVPIGRPIPNVTQYVLDPHRQPVPVGVAGELYLGGAGISRGYVGRPDLTAEKFVALPAELGVEPQEKFYRTGDLVRWQPDGNLVFLGRVDQQVKIRGFRIELGEIEVALAGLPQVRGAAAAVFDRPTADGGRPEKRLVGFMVADQPLDLVDLKRLLGQKLPPYMVPATLVQLEALPLTPNGKIDRRSLPEPPEKELQASIDADLPRSEAEQLLTTVWQEVLRLPQVGVHDNFFDLGGDSIIGIQIVARVRRAGLVIQPRQLFEHQTIADLAAAAQTETHTAAEQGLVSGEAPLTPIQRWFFDQDFARVNEWNQSIWLEPTGAWGPDDGRLLIAAAQHLPAQHDALRLTFSKTADGRWRQTLPAELPVVHIREFDLSTIDPTQQEAAMIDHARSLAAEIDIERGDLLRGGIFYRGQVLPPLVFVTIHHLAIDGVSWRPLLEDWTTAFDQLRRGRAVNLPAKTTSFKRWSEMLVEFGQQPVVQAEIEYWRQQLDRGQPLPLAEGRYPESEGVPIAVELTAAETSALLGEAQQAYRTTINDLLLTALSRAAGDILNIERLAILLEGHGREEVVHNAADVSRTMGWFTSQFPLLLDAGDEQAWGTQLTAIKELRRAIPQTGIGYGVLRNSQTDPFAGRPEPRLTFNYLGQLERSLLAADFFKLHRPLASLIGAGNHRPHGLGVMCFVQDSRFQAVFDYHPDQIDGALVEKLATRYIECLRDLLIHCLDTDERVMTASDFDLLDLDQDAFSDLADLLGNLE